jgi:hypothetical protein
VTPGEMKKVFFLKIYFSSLISLIKELVQPKMSLIHNEFLIWKKRGRGEREKEGRAGRSAGRHNLDKVRFWLGEIEGRDREIERHRNKET